MNRHFKDSQYYLRRAAATAKSGIAEELAPIRARVKQFRGEEDEKESAGRLARMRRRITASRQRGRQTVERAVTRGRRRVTQLRGRGAE